jgi:hypothetical protein
MSSEEFPFLDPIIDDLLSTIDKALFSLTAHSMIIEPVSMNLQACPALK